MMKHSRPVPPKGTPEGTVQLGGYIQWFSVSLHVTNKNLIPEDISSLLSVQPTQQYTQGLPILRDDGSIKRTPKFGRWSMKIKPSDTDEWDVNEVVKNVLTKLPNKISIWEQVSNLGTIHLSIGLNMLSNNQEFMLDIELITILAERKIYITFDIYDQSYN